MACEEKEIELKRWSGGLGIGLDGLIGAVLFSFVYLPVPGLVAGLVFLNDGFHHWNHFVIAPALAHQHGMALSLDVYSPYGLGWPSLVSSMAGLWPLTHQNMIEFASVFAGAYFVGLYFLFRSLVSRRILALAGTLLALWLGFFSPLFMEMPRLETNSQWPSMLILRAPFDAMFFLALLVHTRNARPLYLIVAAFRDGGRGQEDSGIAGLMEVNAAGLAGATVDARLAKTGDGLSSYHDGIISAANELAAAAGVTIGMSAAQAASILVVR